MYDKGIESNTAPKGTVWRVELEAKKGLAGKMWNALLTAPDRQRFCYDSVAEQWSRSGYSWPLPGSSKTGGDLTAPSRPSSDAERLRRWLKTSVSPAVERLLKTHSPDQIARLLNLIPEADAGTA
ncbi:MAG TPA: hypothetical protein VEZ19_12995 [Rubrobacter sp.]|nr:hypothetical protein [Rubrobacter sp.]